MCQITDINGKMPGNFKKEDLRIKKTYTALISSMRTMLTRQNFNQITVNDLCEESLISRATFYVHFNDKYDLLKYWLSNIGNDIISGINKYEQIEATINQFVDKNQKIISNILKDANAETLEIVHSFVAIVIDAFIQSSGNYLPNRDYTILSNFCTGGLVNLILFQVKNRFPSDITMMNSYLYKILKRTME